MFEIKIGTLLMIDHALECIPALRSFGFESYELSCDKFFRTNDIQEFAKRFNNLAEGSPVSALGCYNNPLSGDGTYEDIIHIMEHAHLFDCRTISVFAGSIPDGLVEECIPAFKKVFSELCRRADDLGLEIAIENCPMGSTWNKTGNWNTGFCPDAWERMFDAVPDDCLGLEWEPSHALTQLMDPIAQLRHWVKRVKHVHGKDCTVAWDVIREYGIRGAHTYCWDRTPGFGDTNWGDICTILLQNGYEGYIDIEGYHDPVFYDTTEWSAQKRALDYLKNCRGGREFIEGPAYKGYQTSKAMKKSVR